MVFNLRGHSVPLLFKTNLSFLKYSSNSVSAFSSISYFTLFKFLSSFLISFSLCSLPLFLPLYFLSFLNLILFVPFFLLFLFTVFLNCVLPILFFHPCLFILFFLLPPNLGHQLVSNSLIFLSHFKIGGLSYNDMFSLSGNISPSLRIDDSNLNPMLFITCLS